MFYDHQWILDGGMASTLQNAGFSVDGDPLWSARLLYTAPEAIYNVHKDFLESHAEILTTASYQASINAFVKHLGITNEDSFNLIQKSVSLAKDARRDYIEEAGKNCSWQGDKNSQEPKQILIAGSVGPYGACLADGSEYTGSYIKNTTDDILKNWHRTRIEALISAGVDFLAIETIPALQEAVALLSLLREFPSAKAWISFSCKDGKYTNFGDEFAHAVKQCYQVGHEQLLAIGANCTSPLYISSLLGEANKSLPPSELIPRVVYPNSGEEWSSAGRWISKNLMWSSSSQVLEWASLGANIIGGCCRVMPSDIYNIYGIFRKQIS